MVVRSWVRVRIVRSWVKVRVVRSLENCHAHGGGAQGYMRARAVWRRGNKTDREGGPGDG